MQNAASGLLGGAHMIRNDSFLHEEAGPCNTYCVSSNALCCVMLTHACSPALCR
jgi:hypothetical protein